MLPFLSKLGALREGMFLLLAGFFQGRWELPNSLVSVPDMGVQQQERDTVVNYGRSVSMELPHSHIIQIATARVKQEKNIQDDFPTEEAVHLHVHGL